MKICWIQLGLQIPDGSFTPSTRTPSLRFFLESDDRR
uniref:Uncharacterized protein n=1 Tax=Setaria italica TaxID=4555 RepID=K4AP21_SETIT